MRDLIKIIRIPYEEPDYLQLQVMASNGRQAAEIEIYVRTSDLVEIAAALEAFPRGPSDEFVYELGSEKEEDNWAFYFKFHVFADARGYCAMHFRFNNNRDILYRELAEFCIQSEAAQINRLAKMLRSFAKLEHETLIWSPMGGRLLAPGEADCD
ncbi:hypothetical protein [Arenimonas oryziterrae]|uniref:Uncharacterized protein n=1 Tax=Arenimonas oryziterrae DSM 21050 = YC6267 TaxID=1121015 RepID=A0A091AMB3_9GAMM|nr:hypothetical protein [Arenimonas oryziterrae]KFN41343.1 hypothetical protein N789_05570 [Arenimonas oryziterrae DSM 21050 = YC6267]